ncbi:hypothetical protein QCA50_007767 [Cerrena zonata]|uniref:DUF6534 domain-containing protein n=1 Tax=Cerrena zonata TaxID=2478898 RepID=A0AAW0G6V5_9APHY
MSALLISSPPFDAATFLGGYIMALCIAFILYGITIGQTYLFMINSKKDTVILRTTVTIVAILETIHTIFIIRQMYYLTVIGFGDSSIVQTFDWSTGGFFFAENGIVLLVDGFYIRRIWILSGQRLLPTIGLATLLVLCFGFHMAAASYTFIIPTWPRFYQKFGSSLSVEVANTTSAALDGLIAASMIFLLNRSQTGYRRTDGILRWIIAYSVNTGLLTM